MNSICKQNTEPQKVRCAIYTRKSTDEGLDQEFNTLDAQREAAEAYIASQRMEGWLALPDRYDDGGFSGGNMERPALQRLMDDAEAGRIDCIVVYKVDRLSRSLLDFARIMEVLDRQNISFVSVTQQFNTTNSMGRLTLNILLSFAQFEREIISERTRDKMSAARRKGKWVGGVPILGYDVDPRGGRLMVNETEAALVREVFETYLREEGLVSTAKVLNQRGLTTKRWKTRKGNMRGGRPFSKNNLFGLLTNMTYIGKVNFRGDVFEGEHPAIVDESIWQRVQERLQKNGRSGGGEVRNRYGAILKGLLYCDACSAAMIHTWTVADGGKRKYRYYVCSHAQKFGWDTCPTKSLPARDIEQIVVQNIRAIGQNDELIEKSLSSARQENEERLLALRAHEQVLMEELRVLSAREHQIANRIANADQTQALGELQDRLRTANEEAGKVRREIAEVSANLVSEKDIRLAFSLFDPVWNSLSPREQARAMRLIVERVNYNPETEDLTIEFHPSGIRALSGEIDSDEEE